MCNIACLEFVQRFLQADEITGKRVIESGGRDVNGSARHMIMEFHPESYLSTDIVPGVGVDQICNAVDLVNTFGEKSFDVLVSTEVLEHVEHWRNVISNYKRVLKPGGVLFITTRSAGFGYHSYNGDFWRYEVADMEAIFKDFEIIACGPDPSEPGVFIKARRPKRFKERDLSKYELAAIDELGVLRRKPCV